MTARTQVVRRAAFGIVVGLGLTLHAASPAPSTSPNQPEVKAPHPPKKESTAMTDKPTTETKSLPKSEGEWATCLTPEQFRILRQKGTERAFTGPYWDNKRQGHYECAGCKTVLFSSKDKFDSGTGWPSYTQPVLPDTVEQIEDRSHGMVRVEVVCRKCKGHLGHVFPDGPAPTGLRYCINGHALKFVEGATDAKK